MKNFDIKPIHVILAFVAFWLFCLPSLYSFHEPKSIKHYEYLIISGILCYSTYRFAKATRWPLLIKAAVVLLIVSSSIDAIQGLYQYVVLGIERPNGPYSHPNILAAHLEAVIPIVLALILSSRSLLKEKVTYWAALMVLLGALMVTLSRGAWIAVLIVTMLMLLHEKNYKFLIYTAVSMFMVGALRFKEVWGRINSIFDPNMQSNAERLNGYQSSIIIMGKYPFTGIGFQRFDQVYPQYMIEGAQEHLLHAHNLLLCYGTEAGVLAAFAFSGFVILAIYYIVVNYKHISDSEHRYLVLGAGCGMLALMLNGLVEYTLVSRSNLYVFMFEMGLCLGLICRYVIGASVHKICPSKTY